MDRPLLHVSNITHNPTAFIPPQKIHPKPSHLAFPKKHQSFCYHDASLSLSLLSFPPPLSTLLFSKKSEGNFSFNPSNLWEITQVPPPKANFSHFPNNVPYSMTRSSWRQYRSLDIKIKRKTKQAQIRFMLPPSNQINRLPESLFQFGWGLINYYYCLQFKYTPPPPSLLLLLSLSLALSLISHSLSLSQLC